MKNSQNWKNSHWSVIDRRKLQTFISFKRKSIWRKERFNSRNILNSKISRNCETFERRDRRSSNFLTIFGFFECKHLTSSTRISTKFKFRQNRFDWSWKKEVRIKLNRFSSLSTCSFSYFRTSNFISIRNVLFSSSWLSCIDWLSIFSIISTRNSSIVPICSIFI